MRDYHWGFPFGFVLLIVSVVIQIIETSTQSLAFALSQALGKELNLNLSDVENTKLIFFFTGWASIVLTGLWKWWQHKQLSEP